MELVINDNTYYIPNDWSQISLGKYMSFMVQYEDAPDEYTKQLVTISAFTNAPIELLEGCKKSDIDEVLNQLNKLTENTINSDLNTIITIDSIDYGFHPNLHELKLKEFVDLDNKLSNGWSDMDSVMAILYRPITEQEKDKDEIEEYDFRSAKERAKLFKDKLSVSTVNGAAGFFLNIGMDYINTTQHFLKNQPRKTRRQLIRQMKKRLAKGMAGIVLSITWLMVIY
jgi:hypothetical protein